MAEWYRAQSDMRDSNRVVELTERFGALGELAWRRLLELRAQLEKPICCNPVRLADRLGFRRDWELDGEGWLAAAEELGLVSVSGVGSVRTIEIRSWSRYQDPLEQALEKKRRRNREYYQRRKDSVAESDAESDADSASAQNRVPTKPQVRRGTRLGGSDPDSAIAGAVSAVPAPPVTATNLQVTPHSASDSALNQPVSDANRTVYRTEQNRTRTEEEEESGANGKDFDRATGAFADEPLKRAQTKQEPASAVTRTRPDSEPSHAKLDGNQEPFTGDWGQLNWLRDILAARSYPPRFPVRRLDRPAFWEELALRTEPSNVNPLTCLQDLISWWEIQPPSRRVRNVDRSLRSWVLKEIANEQRRRAR